MVSCEVNSQLGKDDMYTVYERQVLEAGSRRRRNSKHLHPQTYTDEAAGVSLILRKPHCKLLSSSGEWIESRGEIRVDMRTRLDYFSMLVSDQSKWWTVGILDTAVPASLRLPVQPKNLAKKTRLRNTDVSYSRKMV
jgi:hypothetical protein